MGLLLRHNSGAPRCYGRWRRSSDDRYFRHQELRQPAVALVRVVKFLLLAAMVGLMFLLAQSMVAHRFFRGGWVDEHDVLNP